MSFKVWKAVYPEILPKEFKIAHNKKHDTSRTYNMDN